MPAFPPSAIDDVEVANQRTFSEHNQVFSQQLMRMNAGDQAIADVMRQGFVNSSKAIDAVITQALLGSDPTLAATTEAFRSVQGEPQIGTVNQPGLGTNAPKPT